MATTPSVEMAVMQKNADGGIILSASHNPAEWNALKLLNGCGEFLSAEQGQTVLDIAHNGHVRYVRYDELGTLAERDFLDDHIDEILKLPFVDVDKIRARKFKVVVDGINSIGGVAVPRLLERLGIAGSGVVCLDCEPTGHFAHEAEPLPANLTELMELVGTQDAALGIAVATDADRLPVVSDCGACSVV